MNCNRLQFNNEIKSKGRQLKLSVDKSTSTLIDY